MKKRILSLLLAVCMLVSLLPVGMLSASAATTEPTLSYKFKAAAAASSETVFQYSTDLNWQAAGSDYVTPSTVTGKKFTYASVAGSEPLFYLLDGYTAKSAMLFVIRVDESGVYTPEVIFDSMNQNRNTTAHFYLTDDSVLTLAEAEKAENLLIDIPDMDSATVVTGHKATSTKEVALAEGFYHLWFVQDDPNGDLGQAFVPLDTLNLYKAGGIGIYLTGAESRLEAGDTMNLTANVIPASAANMDVTWKSSDNEVATVDGGVVTAVADGVATITATCAGKSASVSVIVGGTLKQTFEIQDYVVENGKVENGKDLPILQTANTEIGVSTANYGDWTVHSYSDTPDFYTGAAYNPTDVIEVVGYYAISFTAQETGVYGLNAIMDVWNSSAGGDVYFTPAKIDGVKTTSAQAFVEENKVAHIDWGKRMGNTADVEFGGHTELDLIAGQEYTLWLKKESSYTKYEEFANATNKYGHYEPDTGDLINGNGDRYFFADALELYKIRELLVSNVTISGVEDGQSMIVGDTCTLSATVEPAVEDAVWSVQGDAVSFDEETGILTAVKAGTATITATAGGKFDSVTVVVGEKKYDFEIQDYVIDSKTITTNGQSASILETANTEKGVSTANYGDWTVHSYSATPVVYIGADYNPTDVIYVSGYYAIKFTAKESGMYTAKAIMDVWSSSADGDVYLTKASVESTAEAFVEANKVTHITWGRPVGNMHNQEHVGTTQFALVEGEEYALWIKAEPSYNWNNGTYVNPETDKTENGQNDRYFFIDALQLFRVGDVAVTGIELTADTTLVCTDQPVTITPVLDPESAGYREADIVWESSDDSIATVNGGVVTGHKIGNVTITATIDGQSDSIDLTVGEISKYEIQDFAVANSATALLNATTESTEGYGNWEFFQYDGTPSLNASSYTWSNVVAIGKYYAIKVNVAKSGVYAAQVISDTVTNSADADLYISKAPATALTTMAAKTAYMEESLVEENKFVSVPWGGATGDVENMVSMSAAPKALEAGEYVLWVKKEASYNSDSYTNPETGELETGYKDRYFFLDAINLIRLIDGAISTTAGASMRYNDPMGLRFVSTIDKELLDDVETIGTVLIPAKALDGATKYTTNDIKLGAKLNGYTVADCPNTAARWYKDNGDSVSYTAVLINIAPANYGREIIARSYMILKDGTVVYGNCSEPRSILTIAEAIHKNPKQGEKQEAKECAAEIYHSVNPECDICAAAN